MVKAIGKQNRLLLFVALFCSLVFASAFGMSQGDYRIAGNVETFEPVNGSASPQSAKHTDASGTVITDATAATEQNTATDDAALQLLADIRVHSAEELMQLLSRVDRLFLQNEARPENIKPVVFLLHGEEARTLFKSQYRENKNVVDLAAKLSAFGVVDIKVCERWAGNKGLDVSNLQPFVGTVPYAPAEQRQLLGEQGYVYF